MTPHRITALGLTLLLCLFASAEAARTVRVASGFARPLYVTAPPQDYGRIFIVEQWTARIRILHHGSGAITTFLDIDSLVIGSGNERGLLGLVFHPDYAVNGYFFVHYNNNAGNSVISRYQVSADPDVANANSRFDILAITQPASFTNHKGGMIAFGPDGYLYIGMGDGGSGNDPGNRAQSDSTLLGKLLRIDVDGGSPYAIPPDNPFIGHPARDEIWAKGLRNPWRWSFDRATGDLWIADVGQNAWEEVNVQPAASDGGENYGWRCMEGDHCTGLTGCTCFSPALTLPVHEYSHGTGCSITGGFVYRGCAIPEYTGLYFFADYCSDIIWSGRYDAVNDTLVEVTNRTAELAPGGGLTIGDISSFGEDAYGELYVTDLLGGEVFKLIPDTLTDCNANGVADACDIAAGHSADANGNAVPDECDCAAIEVGDLTAYASGGVLTLRWSAAGNGTETYTVYRAAQPDTQFPGPGWSVIASNLPAFSGDNAMLYADATGIPAGERNFYIVTSNCP